MNADKLFVFNRRLSAFIGGWVISSVFQHPVSTPFHKFANVFLQSVCGVRIRICEMVCLVRRRALEMVDRQNLDGAPVGFELQPEPLH